jgi:hypothetical protein
MISMNKTSSHHLLNRSFCSRYLEIWIGLKVAVATTVPASCDEGNHGTSVTHLSHHKISEEHDSSSFDVQNTIKLNSTNFIEYASSYIPRDQLRTWQNRQKTHWLATLRVRGSCGLKSRFLCSFSRPQSLRLEYGGAGNYLERSLGRIS